jgi:hypothetical protein
MFAKDQSPIHRECALQRVIEWGAMAYTVNKSSAFIECALSYSPRRTIMFEFHCGSGLINESEVVAARAAGLLIHHEVDGYWDEDEYVITRDDWYAASPAFVASYLSNGGMWVYSD